MSSFQSFLNFISDYQVESRELVKCSAFSKRVPRHNKGDLISFCNERVLEDILKNELIRLVEESNVKAWKILLSSYHLEKNRIFLKIGRSSLLKAVLVEICERQSAFGDTNVFHGKTYIICCGESSKDLTNLRVATAARLVAALVTRGCGSLVCEPSESTQMVYLGQSRTLGPSEGHFILVNQACVTGLPNISEADFKQLRREDMLAMGDHKDITELSLNKIVDAAVTFDLLSIKLEKPIVLDSSAQPKSARKSNCKGASFVLYNYARLCAILDKYDYCVADGVYKSLLPVQDVNYDLLSDEYEWRLVYDYLVEWPSIVSECQELNQPKLHRITGFLSSLASTFSIYYRHTRVLNDGLPHMLPLMEARIHLLLAIKQVFLIAFSLLGIDAPTTM